MLFHCKKCGGGVIEDEKVLDPSRKFTTLVCLMCGHNLEVLTTKYIKFLKALNVDFSRRLP